MTTAQKSAIPRADLVELVRSAILAPSGHNTQPWRFVLGAEGIEIRPDFSRRLPVVDPDDHALYISLGAALENLRIAARRRGLEAETVYFPAGSPDSLIVRFTRLQHPVESEWLHAIPLRQSTRSRYDGRAIPSDDLRALERASKEDGVAFRLFIDRNEIEAVTELLGPAPWVERAVVDRANELGQGGGRNESVHVWPRVQLPSPQRRLAFSTVWLTRVPRPEQY